MRRDLRTRESAIAPPGGAGPARGARRRRTAPSRRLEYVWSWPGGARTTPRVTPSTCSGRGRDHRRARRPMAVRTRARSAAPGPRRGSGISQSGQSPDVAAVLAAARAQNRPTIAITNDPPRRSQSMPMSWSSWGSGRALSVAATTTYPRRCMPWLKSRLSFGPAGSGASGSAGFPRAVTGWPMCCSQPRAVRPLASLGLLTVVGRGLDYATAFETALKLREIAASRPRPTHPPTSYTARSPRSTTERRCGRPAAQPRRAPRPGTCCARWARAQV